MSLSTFTSETKPVLVGGRLVGTAGPPVDRSNFSIRLFMAGNGGKSKEKPDSVFGNVSPSPRIINEGSELVEVNTWLAVLVYRSLKGYKVIGKRQRPRQTLFGRISYTTIYQLERGSQ